jgi:hypothetical protein
MGAVARSLAAIAATALASVCPPISATELEIGNPQRAAPPGAGELPPQYPLEGTLLQFAPGGEAARAFRDKIARHAERPVLVLVVPDATAGQAAHPRLVWLGNLLRSGDRRLQRTLGLLDVVPALLRDVQAVIPEARSDALCYVVGLRDGRPFAWPLSASAATEESFLRTVTDGALTGGSLRARAKAWRDGLTERERADVDAAVRNLGDREYAKRAAGSRELARRMPDIGPYLAGVMESAGDPEVRARCSEVLTDAGRAWLERAPAGCSWTPWHGGRIGLKGQVQLRAVIAN